MVADRRDKNLCFLFQPPERLAVNDAVTVSLIDCPDLVFRLSPVPSETVDRM